VLTGGSLLRALKRVRASRGADDVGRTDWTVEHQVRISPGHLKEEQLPRGEYRPSPLRRVEIPEPEGSLRELGIQAVMAQLLGGRSDLYAVIGSPDSFNPSHGRVGAAARAAMQRICRPLA